MTGTLPFATQLQLHQPLASLESWTQHFLRAEIPVLQATAESLEVLRENEDQTDANSIGEMISGDPLMTLKVLAYAANHRSSRVVTSAETVTAALVMIGISPFFRAFPAQPTVEATLADHDGALVGLEGVMRRAYRGADLALGFAIHRTTPNAAAIHAAGLLHELAEMLLWIHAPELALRIQKAQIDSPTLRSSAAQRAILGIDLADLQSELIKSWKLPSLLCETQNELQPGNTDARTVELAARLARHTSAGWENAAIPDDIQDVAALLNLSLAASLHFVKEISPN